MDYLQSLENKTFPLQVTDPDAVQCVCVLRAAHLIEAELSPPSTDDDEDHAVISQITPHGRALLARRRQRQTTG